MINEESKNTQIDTGKIPAEIIKGLQEIKAVKCRGDIKTLALRIREDRALVSTIVNGDTKRYTLKVAIKIIRGWHKMYPELINTTPTESILKTA